MIPINAKQSMSDISNKTANIILKNLSLYVSIRMIFITPLKQQKLILLWLYCIYIQLEIYCKRLNNCDGTYLQWNTPSFDYISVVGVKFLKGFSQISSLCEGLTPEPATWLYRPARLLNIRLHILIQANWVINFNYYYEIYKAFWTYRFHNFITRYGYW